jgi:hypothetical protein
MRAYQKLSDEIEVLKEEEAHHIINSNEEDYLYVDQGDEIHNILRFLQLFAEGHYTDL